MGKPRKISYQSPQLEVWGTVHDLTAVGLTNPAMDCMSGSVYPEGHEDGCPEDNGNGRGNGNGNGRGNGKGRPFTDWG
jgi:hypothetical protein